MEEKVSHTCTTQMRIRVRGASGLQNNLILSISAYVAASKALMEPRELRIGHQKLRFENQKLRIRYQELRIEHQKLRIGHQKCRIEH